MTQQIAVRIPNEMAAKLHEYVAAGRYANRTAAVQAAIQGMIDYWETKEIAEAYRRAYSKHPQDPAESEAWAKLAAETMEPW